MSGDLRGQCCALSRLMLLLLIWMKELSAVMTPRKGRVHWPKITTEGLGQAGSLG